MLLIHGCGLLSRLPHDKVVQTGIINWTSHVKWIRAHSVICGPSTELYNVADVNFYDRISNTDFRKLEFKAPEGSPLADKVSYVNKVYSANMADYTMVKFPSW